MSANTNLFDLSDFAEPLLFWYDKNKRSMIWRDNPTPYNVWISEIMLQQTRIEAAKAYFVRFMETLPTTKHLAEAEEEVLMKLWEGLGYYNRARNLKKTAEVLIERYDGRLPAGYDCLIGLPGIGPYTAGAIASIAYGIKEPAVDGNVLRVIMRYMNCDEDIGKSSLKKKVEHSLTEVMPDRPGDFNQAIMELGEVICIPNGEPHCGECPLNETCLAYKYGTWRELPKKADKKPRKIEELTIMVFEYENTFGIRKRPDRGLLAGMYEFPSREGKLSSDELNQYLTKIGIKEYKIIKLGNAKHIFSHIEWHMTGYRILLEGTSLPEQMPGSIHFVSKEELMHEYALPVAFQKYKNQILFKTEKG